ncbi:hypothetical protein SteCoe_13410 [Stentor coeruleus]|uniref:Anaphase-promoting complex subunit 4 WD40 domain-containing protein n=1 Tax=Stentor coeruleus TaxID=5963 RepID=A0A1R2C8H3_9CILI|nr:hypothetical protein SteCoe_13410 [Stentor coeruleus]
MRFIDNGQLALFLTSSGFTHIWDMHNLILIATFNPNKLPQNISLSLDRNLMATLTYESGKIIIRNLADMKKILTIKESYGKINKYYYLKKLDKVLIVHEDMSLKVWNLKTFKYKRLTQVFVAYYNNLTVFNDRYACIGTISNNVIVYDMKNMNIIFNIAYQKVGCFFLSYDKKVFVCAGPVIAFWDFKKVEKLKEYCWEKDYIISIGLNENSRILVAGTIEKLYYIIRYNLD